MAKRRKGYALKFICVEDRTGEIVRGLARRQLLKVAKENGVVFTNLEEVLHKYIPDHGRPR